MGENWEFRVDIYIFSFQDKIEKMAGRSKTYGFGSFFLMGGEEVNNIARGVKDIVEIKFQEGTKVYQIGAGLFDEIPRFCFYFKSNTVVNEKPNGCLRAFWVSLKSNLRLAFHIVIL